MLRRQIGIGGHIGAGLRPTHGREGAGIGIALAFDAFKVKRGE